MKKGRQPDRVPQISMRSEVARQIRQHARSAMKTEVCGVLIGRDGDSIVTVEACIPGINAAQAGAHVTFTQDTWEHIYKIKDVDYPDQRIVGWYHSHPGFGVFLSEHDQFIQQNFFSAPTQLAWVYDPHSDEEGCFGWHGGQIERLAEVCMKDDGTAVAANSVGSGSADTEVDLLPADPEPRPGWVDILFTVLSYTAIFALGVLLAFFLLPERTVLVPVTPEQMEQFIREHNQGSAVPQGEEASSDRLAPNRPSDRKNSERGDPAAAGGQKK